MANMNDETQTLRNFIHQGKFHTYHSRVSIGDNEGVDIQVTPAYIPEKSVPEKRQFVYAYHIKITNHRPLAIKLLFRHWKIKEGKGKVTEVQGPGVAGEKPLILPGETFEYSSFCPLMSPYGSMRGKYQFIDQYEERFWAEIPLFFLKPLNTMLH